MLHYVIDHKKTNNKNDISMKERPFHPAKACADFPPRLNSYDQEHSKNELL